MSKNIYFRKRRRIGYLKPLVLIALALVVLYGIFSFFPKNFGKTDNEIMSQIFSKENVYLHDTQKYLKKRNIKDKIVILSIYDVKDLESILFLEKVTALKEKYKDKIAIIDIVPLGNFESYDAITMSYIVKSNIERPILSISNEEIGKVFKTTTYPSLLVLSYEKNVFSSYSDKVDFNSVKEDINALIKSKEKPKKTKKEQAKDYETEYANLLVKSLSKLEYGDNFKYGPKKSVLFIADAKGNKIFVITFQGKIIYQIGSGKKGFEDGDFSTATFCSPEDILYGNNVLYIADACNSAIRKIDFKKEQVSTVIKDDEILKNIRSLAFFPDTKNIIASGSGITKLAHYDISKKTLESLKKAEGHSEISKIIKHEDKLYFIDAIANKLSYLDTEGNVKEFLNLEEILSKDLDINFAKITDFHIDDTGIYIVGNNENKILKLHSEDEKEIKASIYSGNGKSGNKIGEISETEYNSPSAILAVKDRLYVTDEDNYRIVQIDKNKNQTSAITVAPDVFSKGFNGLNKYLDDDSFKEKEKFTYDKEGKIIIDPNNKWQFKEQAPNYLYLFEQDETNAILIENYSTKEILSKELSIPKLKKGKTYYIQGTFYYCQKEKPSPCLVKKFKRKIVTKSKDRDNELVIEFE